MMANFSERNNLNTPKEIQLNYVDENLKIRIWNILNIILFEKSQHRSFGGSYYEESQLINIIWINLFNKDADLLGTYLGEIKANFKKVFFESEWHVIYSLIEEIIKDKKGTKFCSTITDTFNRVLQKENSAYRIVNEIVSPLTNQEEINEIEKSINLSDKYISVRHHIGSSQKLLSDRKHPDYRNSIKESISAVEAICKIITEKENATLGEALKKLGEKVEIHPALIKGFDSIYGYTNDKNGIRHAMMELSSITYEDALFFLVSCSSFVNYLISKFEGNNEN